MVEFNSQINDIFAALSDPIRRDIFERTTDAELNINQIALDYDISLAAVSKHIKVMLQAGLIIKRKDGRFNFVRSHPEGLREGAEYIRQFDQFWYEGANRE